MSLAESDNKSLLSAFATVRRERHLSPPPWDVADETKGWWRSSDLSDLYADTIVSLDRPKGINNGSPLLWARAFSSAPLCRGNRIQHIGCGGGYYTAILAELVGREGFVDAWDTDSSVAAIARDALSDDDAVEINVGNPIHDGKLDHHGVVCSAGLSEIPRSWLQAGRLQFMVFPLAGMDTWLTDFGERQNATRGGLVVASAVSPNRFAAKITQQVSFYPCEGCGNIETAAAILKAFAAGGWQDVRHLLVGDAQTDDSDLIWLQGDGWQLTR